VALLVFAGSGAARTPLPPGVPLFSVGNGGAPFAGDGQLLTTITPNGDGLRDSARIHFRLAGAALVKLEIAVVRSQAPELVRRWRLHAHAGLNTVVWAPPPTIEPRAYLVLCDIAGHRYGKYQAHQRQDVATPVIRVQGIDAGFTRESYRSGAVAWLHIAADAPSLSFQLFREGPERQAYASNSALYGVPVSEPADIPWERGRDRPRAIRIAIGERATGLYYAKLIAPDGRAGYAPFIVRPTDLGEHRAAIVLPTNTWQAYNHEDEDADGWGDTWYAGWVSRTVRLGRHFVGWGIPPRFRAYDLNFLRWLVQTHREVDYLSDTDLEHVKDAETLAAAYDLIVFPGHHEYVTQHEFDLVHVYRNLGGNLIFLSANNFYWQLDKDGRFIRRTARFRRLHEPEAGLIGTAYVANDRGGHPKSWVVRDPAATPWLFEGTGLERGSSFGLAGIEVDERSPASPRGTIIVASIPKAIGRHRADMTYYERGGAKVFAAGAFTLAGEATWGPIVPLMNNLWNHMIVP
jgi:N,N-dimethylformamidase beta subunit-like protein